MCKKIFRIVFWMLTVLMMVLIFVFSSENANSSQRTSEGFTKKILSISKSFNSLTEFEQITVIEQVQFFVRKAAHFSAFALLSISLLSAMLLTFKKRFLWLYTFIISVVYAISDEIHQLFVPGRSCRIGDVFIDSMGALSGILIVLIITMLYKYQKLKKAKR